VSDGTGVGAPTITVNGDMRPLTAPATLMTVLEEAGLAGRPVAVELNGEVVPRGRFAECRLTGGERIEIVTFVGGG
jgi:sulfur carrier protein